MEMLLRKYGNALVAIDDYNADLLAKIKSGEDRIYKTKKARNPRFHRKFFALIKIGHDNTDLNMPIDSYRKYITVKAGFFERFPTKKGEYIEAKSIAFDKMDDRHLASTQLRYQPAAVRQDEFTVVGG